MIIVIIHWKIKLVQEKVEEFLEFWRKTALVGDRTGRHCHVNLLWVVFGNSP